MADTSELRFMASHEWVRVEGDVAYVGISDHAQEALGDVVHVEMPEVGNGVNRGEPAAEIESVKAVSDIYAPISGTVESVNEGLEDVPERVNTDPYGKGWLFSVRMSNPEEIDEMLTDVDYAATLTE